MELHITQCIVTAIIANSVLLFAHLDMLQTVHIQHLTDVGAPRRVLRNVTIVLTLATCLASVGFDEKHHRQIYFGTIHFRDKQRSGLVFSVFNKTSRMAVSSGDCQHNYTFLETLNRKCPYLSVLSIHLIYLVSVDITGCLTPASV